MRVIDHLQANPGRTAFSFEILPPLKGNSIEKVYNIIDKLRDFDPKYINITSHHSEMIFKEMPDGSFRPQKMRKRPGSVAIASAIQNKYGITAVPHIICKGFTRDETEYALIDLNFLGVHDLLLLRGDIKGPEKSDDPTKINRHATDLQAQVNDFNRGIYADGETFEPNATPFSYGMACYPEKHEEAPNMDSDLYYAKQKVDGGADYLVTQMFLTTASILTSWSAAARLVSRCPSCPASSLWFSPTSSMCCHVCSARISLRPLPQSCASARMMPKSEK